ncbi:ABC transporter substrate-binding protein [Cryobacterium sp.]|uniref:ABC transporter substrate-binding protein n=1 Tax=Cryobacterium sp. TaxID=1926290 RepID=UPI0026150501|nr:ABC transporter substrate-binding protein [Cryobacterium sp.]MCU1446992.1 transporter substrate-binding protein [Cryobacterium sp.]
MKRILFGATAVATALLLAGCSTPAAESDNAPAEPLGLKIGFQTNGGQTPPYVATEEGIFEENGLDVERVEFQDATSMIAALERGDVDMISTIPGGPLAARGAGFDLKAVIQNEAAKYEAPDSGTIIVQEDSTIETLDDLEGATIGIAGGVKGQLTAGAMWAMQEDGIDTASMTFVDAPFPTHLDMLKSKQVDAVITIDPFTTSILQSGVGRVLDYPYLMSNPGQPLSAWWAPGEWIDENPDLVKMFRDSLKASIDWLYEEEDRARETVAEFTGLDPALVAEMPLNNWSYNVDEPAWEKNIEILVAMEALPETQDLDDIFIDAMKDDVAESALGR